jgi:hypothetical protein
MAFGKKKPAGDASKSLKVVARPAKFRRCGREFGAEPTLIALSELSEEEVEILQTEKMLVCELVDTPKAEPEKK